MRTRAPLLRTLSVIVALCSANTGPIRTVLRWLAPARLIVPTRLPFTRTATLPQVRQVDATTPTRLTLADVRVSVAPVVVVVT